MNRAAPGAHGGRLARRLRAVARVATWGITVAFSLAASAGAQEGPEPIPVLLVSGANNHAWEWTTPSLRSMLEDSGRFRVDVTTTPGETLADAAALSEYRAFVLDYNGDRWGEAAEAAFLAAVEGGTGVVVVHAANNAFPGWTDYERMVGHLWREGTKHGAFHAFDVVIHDRGHPVTAGLPDLVAHPDELYHRLWEAPGHAMTVIATAYSDPETGGSGRHEPMIMVGAFGRGRIFHTPLGHVWRNNEPSRASHLDPQFRQLIVRGTEWAATGAVTSASPGLMPDAAVLPRVPGAGPDDLDFDALPAGQVHELLSVDGAAGPAGPGLAGWTPLGDAAWTREGDDVIGAVDGGGQSFLITDRSYGDFILDVELLNERPGNSGIQIRSHVREDGRLFGYQIEIDPSERAWSGGLYDEGRRGWLDDLADDPSARAAFKPGEWNHYRIACLGPHIRTWVNGVPVADYDDSLDVEGVIGLQVHSGNDTQVRWRRPRLVDLSTRRWRPLFDGSEITGLSFDGALQLDDDGRPPIEDGVMRLRMTGPARVRLPTEGDVEHPSIAQDVTLRVRYREVGGVFFVGLRLAGDGVPDDQGRTGSSGLWFEEGVGWIAWPRPGEREGQWRQLDLNAHGGRISVDVDGERIGSWDEPGRPRELGALTLELRAWGEGEVQLREVSVLDPRRRPEH